MDKLEKTLNLVRLNIEYMQILTNARAYTDPKAAEYDQNKSSFSKARKRVDKLLEAIENPENLQENLQEGTKKDIEEEEVYKKEIK